MFITMNDALKLERNFAPDCEKYFWEISKTEPHLVSTLAYDRLYLELLSAYCKSGVYHQRMKEQTAFSFDALIYYTIRLYD